MEGGLSNIFNWAIGIGAILALMSIIYSGIIYTVSAGNESLQKQARERIKAAILGMAFLIGAYILLLTIDPRILNPQPEILRFPADKLRRQKQAIQDPQGLLTEAQRNEADGAIRAISGATHAEVVIGERGEPILKIYDQFGIVHTYDLGYGFR